MRGGLIFIGIIISFTCIPTIVWAWKAACYDPLFGNCFGILQTCPASCPRLCEVDCKVCKPYCAGDRPGVAQFNGGDGKMLYFHGSKKDKDLCLVSDSEIHINAHYIGKRSNGRDFNWVQSIGISFDSHQLYIGAKRIVQWRESDDNMLIELDGMPIMLPAGAGTMWWSEETGLEIHRQAETNKVKVKVDGLFVIGVRVVPNPISLEESRGMYGYDLTEDDWFAHLELSFKFESLSKRVDGVLGQSYRPGYQKRVKMTEAMPIMGEVDKFTSSNLFATDCAVSNFGLKPEVVAESRKTLREGRR